MPYYKTMISLIVATDDQAQVFIDNESESKINYNDESNTHFSDLHLKFTLTSYSFDYSNSPSSYLSSLICTSH